ncbi:autophagy protein Apg9-domain-containing protein [Scenedesmus sp. NREL 46B-D3]|nr:autophagy protein Apg9-domain-containing protein [Scenedesmus sp. NREL 46B-D3]
MSNRKFEQELATGCQYEPLPSLPEAELGLPDLVGGEGYEWAAIDNLDAFFTRIYRYWHDKGLATILVGRLLNLTALAFTIGFSGFLLLAVNWAALHSECLAAVAEHARPLVALVALYLALCGLYWLWSAAQLVAELRDVLDVKHFINNKLGISDRQIRMMTWSELLHRLVLVQRTSRLCAARDLDELDVVGRIMRKDNYLIGMLNAGEAAAHSTPRGSPCWTAAAGPCVERCWAGGDVRGTHAAGLEQARITLTPLRAAARVPGVLGLYVRGCGPVLGRRFMLTKTLEWNLYLCILDPMFDEHFHIRQDFLADEAKLRRRLVAAAGANLLLSPFLLLFLVIYFFMKHAEKFYHSPGSLGSRRWSSLAKWRLREFNELPHYIQHRLDASYEAAVKYVGQFPSPMVSQVAKFVSFVAGSFAALLLGLSLLDENLLEVPLAGRNVVWWLALTGILLTVSRSFINDTPVAFDPERAMAEVVLHTHHLPRHWRGRAHSAEVQQSLNSMFSFKLLLFLEELASVLLTPFILAYSLPRCAGAILQFVAETTTRVEGVGDVCSLAVFDFGRHGNSKYGAPAHAPAKRLRSKQGKMEKSFLTFVATYPTWRPPAAGRQMLTNIGSVNGPPGQQQQQQQHTAGGAGASGFFGPPAAAAGQAGGGAGGQGRAWALQMWRGQQHPGPVAGGSSSLWVGVPEQPLGLRHPNHQPNHQQQQEEDDTQLRDLADHLFGPLSPDVQPQQEQQQLAARPPAAAAMGSSSSMLSHSRHHPQQQQHFNHLPPHPQAGGSSRMLAPSRYFPQQQHYQQQQQRMPLLQHPSMHGGMHSTQLLQFFPSTMYPGGPSAAAALSQLQPPHVLQQQQHRAAAL